METDATASTLLSPGTYLRERWEIVSKIGGGGFGEIYKALDHSTELSCAVKVESCTSNKQVLKMEVAVLKRLQKSSNHICEFLGCGRNNKVNYVVMTLVGPNLSELRKHQPNQKLSISTTLRVGVQIIAAVQSMHDCGFLHRDIKPSNFSIGDTPDTARMCYMLDYGLARQYTTVTGEVRQPRPVAGFRGTVRYASLNAHLARDLGRHDDLWSVFYLLGELAVGHLPWRRIRDKEEAGEFKAKYDHKKLIRTLPYEMLLFLDHLKACSYFDKPDYQLLTRCLHDAINRLGVQESDPYDWEQDSSAPSVTTASMVSPPAVKLVNEEQGEDAHSPMKTLQTSKTNCSGVGELSDNAHSEPPPKECRLNLTVPQFKRQPISQPRQSVDNHDEWKSKVNPGNGSKPEHAPPVLPSKEISIECVPADDLKIVNQFVSEEEEEYGDAESPGENHALSPHYEQASASHKEASQEATVDNHQHPPPGSICEGVPPMKSYQTESLNRFYDHNAARESVVSYKSCSKRSIPAIAERKDSHGSSQYFSKTSDSTHSSKKSDVLNEAMMVYPEGNERFVNAFNSQNEDDNIISPLPAIYLQETKPEKENSYSSSSTSSSKGSGTKEQESADSPEYVDTEHKSEGSTKVLLLHKLLMKSSSSESESAKSIEVLFAQKTQQSTGVAAGPDAGREGTSAIEKEPLANPYHDGEIREESTSLLRKREEEATLLLRKQEKSTLLLRKQEATLLLRKQEEKAILLQRKQEEATLLRRKQEEPLQLSESDKIAYSREEPHEASKPYHQQEQDQEQEQSTQQLSASTSEPTGNIAYSSARVENPVAEKSPGKTRQTKSDSNFLEVLPQPVRIHPRPPPNPPPLNYSVSLMARRRRFVRAKAKNSTNKSTK